MFTELSGEAHEELRGVCRHSHPTFLQEHSLFFYKPSLLFVVFPIGPITDILHTDVMLVNLHRVIARRSFTIRHCLVW